MKTILLVSALCCAALGTSSDSYFPIRTEKTAEGVTLFESRWYGHALERMNEPRLPPMAKDQHSTVYRLLILPTWGNPIAVRVTKIGELYKLFAGRLDGDGGDDPGKLAETRVTALDAADSEEVERLLRSVHFFQMATFDDVLGDDGDESVFEGVSEGKYHVVTRWCASSYKSDERGLASFLALSRFLLEKSSLSEQPKNKGSNLF